MPVSNGAIHRQQLFFINIYNTPEMSDQLLEWCVFWD